MNEKISERVSLDFIDRLFNPTKKDVRILIEHAYDKWVKAYGRRSDEDYRLAYYDYNAYKDQMYERRKHVAFMHTSPEYAHYVCIKATRYCRLAYVRIRE